MEGGDRPLGAKVTVQAKPSAQGAQTKQGGVQTAVTSVPEASAPLCDFLDLKAQFAEIREEVMAAIAKVMESQLFILGSEVKLLEEEIAGMLGARHGGGSASGTDALVLAMLAVGVGEGDEVITTPFSFVATAGTIAWIRATPVFVDIDPITYNIDVTKIAAAITPRTRAIMPVHLFGLMADMAPILEFQIPIPWALNAPARRPTGPFEDRAMYPAKMAALVFGQVLFLAVFIWVFG